MLNNDIFSTTMGFCTFMKTVEITRHKSVGPPQSTWSIAREIIRREGIRGIFPSSQLLLYIYVQVLIKA